MVIVCPLCDLAHRAGAAPASERTRCARCRAPLQRPENGRIDTAIALSICALVLFFLSNAYPLVAIQSNGTTRASTLVGAALGLYGQDHVGLAALVFITTVVGPFVQIVSLLYLLVPLKYRRQAPGQNTVFRLLAQMRLWTFVEVFMLGAVVALVRLSSFARVLPGVALWSCALLMLTLAALTSRTSAGQFWRWVERCRR
ncbi:MAG TPA: paraquat-inducible protein A [Steroidobacteraceae bacterium]|jgi:paraquat-inducible protein A|nr:paraquat-inducible protein A [Steroidobacteraceae bacterium]